MKVLSHDYLTDEELILLIRSGNEEALNMLCERYRFNAFKRAQNFLAAYSIPGLAPEDLAGEILLTFQSIVENYVLESGHFYPYWLSTITHDMYDYAHYYLRMINAELTPRNVCLDSHNDDGQSFSDFVGVTDEGLRASIFNEDVRIMLLSRGDISEKEIAIFDTLTQEADIEDAIAILKMKKSTFYRRLNKLREAIADILK